jgi:hypothetical protein
MNSSNTAALQSGHHHHHHQSTSSANQQYHHSTSTVSTQQSQLQKPASITVNQNPSVHRYHQTLNDPWLLQSQQQPSTQGPTPPLRQHKKPAPNPPTTSTTPSSSSVPLTTQPQKLNVQHLAVNSTYNQPLYLTSSAQTQTTPGLAPSTSSVLHSQHSPKSPNQNFHLQSGAGSNLMSTSLNSATNMVNNHHHLSSSQAHHHSLSNNNNNNNFDDLNLNGSSSIASSTSHQKKLEMKLNTMP